MLFKFKISTLEFEKDMDLVFSSIKIKSVIQLEIIF